MAHRQGTRNSLKHRGYLSLLEAVVLIALIGSVVYVYLLPRTPQLPHPPLKQLAAAHGIVLGEHAVLNRLGSKPYDSILTSQYASLVVDGEAHWIPLRPSSTQYDYQASDQLVAFATAHHMSVEMHHLIWGDTAFLPKWLKNGDYNKEALLGLMHDHITNVAGHYKGRVAAWTVVNEAFTRAQQVYGLHDWWAEHTGGLGYIDSAFIWARQADPTAKLLLSDFNNETENSISTAQYNYAKAAKARGIPIDGIGMQMHISAAHPPDKAAVIQNMRRFAALGLPVYVTEFDVNVNSVNGDNAYKRQLEADITYDMVRACIESHACVSFVEFGMTDKNDLLKRLAGTDSHSYLFDSRYRPKPSFNAFRQAWQQP